MRTFMIALRLFVVLTVLTGLAYPLLITGIAQGVFPAQANGSLVVRGGKVVGSRLIGQSFDGPRYFWGRPSATSGFAYNAALSGGSNLGPTNPALMEQIEARCRALREADPENAAPIPTELVTASASGLDPHISPESAKFQVARVARARGLSEAAVQSLVDQHTQRPVAGLGEPVVNVLELNLDLDKPDH